MRRKTPFSLARSSAGLPSSATWPSVRTTILSAAVKDHNEGVPFLTEGEVFHVRTALRGTLRALASVSSSST